MTDRSGGGRVSKPRRKAGGSSPSGAAEEIEAAVVDLEQAVTSAGAGAAVSDIFARLGRLTGKRAADVITARLIEDRSEAPALLLDLLPAIGGKTAGEAALRKIARTAEASDALRIEAKRMIGWPEDGQAARRRTFLKSLRDAESAIVGSALLAANFWPMRPSMFEETLGYIDALPHKSRLAVVERLAAELPARGLPLLHALLHLPDRIVQLAAIEIVRGRGYRVSSGALRRLARTTGDSLIRDAANAAARRLQIGIAGSPATSGHDEEAWPPLPATTDIFVTIIDGSGGQSFQIARQHDAGLGVFVSYLMVERGGLWDYVGIDRRPTDEIADIVDRFAEVSPNVDIDLAAVRGGIELALDTNEATGTPIPPEFELWEPFSHDEYPPLDDEALTLPILDDASAPIDPARIANADELIDHDFFESWSFPLDAVSDAIYGIEPPADGVLTDTQYHSLIDAVADDATIESLRHRLQRQAWLLEQDGENDARDLALAVSALLRDADAAARRAHPFLRAMTEVSVHSIVSNPYAALEDMLLAHGITIDPDMFHPDMLPRLR